MSQPSNSPAARRRRLALDLVLALLVVPVLLYFALRRMYATDGVVEVADDQVAVVVDALSGERRVSTVPGYQLFVPWKEEVHVLDKSPDELVFEGTQWVEPNQAPWIEARGRDGSRFSFERFSLSYALVAAKADAVLEDSGPGDGFKRDLVRAYARACVRDEIGRLSPEEVLRPDVARTAMTRVMERMNTALLRHGIEVLEVATPKPTFDKAFEDLINRRKQGDLEIERKRTYLAQLPKERGDRLQAIRDDKERELELLGKNLAVNRAAAERETQKLRLEADIVFANRSKAGEAARVELATRAAGLRQRHEGALEDARRETENLERYGEFAVRAALVQRLAEVQFRLLPYSRDAAPKRVEHEDVQAAAAFEKGGRP
ncbi:MAG: hypothetical protein HZA53_19365 [Planctomycetes bacterium]|nr:hypothetical protein [Planctomycetota bacterium]